MIIEPNWSVTEPYGNRSDDDGGLRGMLSGDDQSKQVAKREGSSSNGLWSKMRPYFLLASLFQDCSPAIQ
jgi:hypothetical protein